MRTRTVIMTEMVHMIITAAKYTPTTTAVGLLSSAHNALDLDRVHDTAKDMLKVLTSG